MRRCLGPLKAEPQEVFGCPNTYSQGIWKTRVWLPGFRFPEPIFDTMKVFFHTEEGTKLKTHSLTCEEYLQDSSGEAILQNVRGKDAKNIG